MLLEFFIGDFKLLLAWAGSALAVFLQNIKLDVLLEYELWKIISMDVLTFILLVVTILYTIKKWRLLNKQNKEKRNDNS